MDIAVSELMRWWGEAQHRYRVNGSPTVVGEQRSTPSENTQNTANDSEVTARVAALEAEITGLKNLLAEVRESREELRESRAAWQAQAERMTLALPKPADEPRPWWRRLAG